MGFALEFGVCSISPEPFERFSFNFTQMFLWLRLWAEHMTQLPRLKVTLQSHGIYHWISCPFHIYWTLWTIFIELPKNVPLSETVCRTHDSAAQAQCQCHTIRSLDLSLTLVSAPYLMNPWTIFGKFHPNVSLIDTMCVTYDSASHNQGQGLTSRSWDLPLNICPLHISWTLSTIFIELDADVTLSGTVCRTNDSTVQAQGHGHSSRSLDLPLNFVSAQYLLNPLNDFH